MSRGIGVLLALFIFAGGSWAQAGILFDPYFGYQVMGTYDTGASSNNRHKLTGPAFGARLGYNLMGLAFGAEYLIHDSSLVGDYSGNPNYKFKGNGLGAFLSVSPIAIPLRFIATYFFQIANNRSGEGVDTDFRGDGYKVGLHYVVMPFISIGLEYFAQTQKEAKYNNSGSSNFNSLDPKTSINSYMLVVSFPLGF